MWRGGGALDGCIQQPLVQLVVGVLLYLSLMVSFRGDVVNSMQVKHGVFQFKVFCSEPCGGVSLGMFM